MYTVRSETVKPTWWISAVILAVAWYLTLCWRKANYMSGRILHIRDFNFLIFQKLRSHLMVAPVGMNALLHNLEESNKSHLAKRRCGLELIWCLECLWRYSVDWLSCSVSKRRTQLSSAVTLLHKNSSTSQSRSTSCRWTRSPLFQFLSQHHIKLYVCLLLPTAKRHDSSWSLNQRDFDESSRFLFLVPCMLIVTEQACPRFASRTLADQTRRVLTRSLDLWPHLSHVLCFISFLTLPLALLISCGSSHWLGQQT
jgi:hypothetical protein